MCLREYTARNSFLLDIKPANGPIIAGISLTRDCDKCGPRIKMKLWDDMRIYSLLHSRVIAWEFPGESLGVSCSSQSEALGFRDDLVFLDGS